MEDKSEIAFFDVETTVPTRQGQGFALLEFGAILVCPKKLEEVYSYSTLVRPADPSLISSLSIRCNGITPDTVVSAPSFADIADRVYDILHGRIWAGHNIIRFDCARIREAFAEAGRPAPEPKATIDSLHLLTQRFGRRAGDMKMASLATYFGLGQQTHRSLDDVRMNLEVLKYCATVLFLESSLPDIFTENSWVSPNATTRSRSNLKSSPEGTKQNLTSRLEETSDVALPTSVQPDPFDLGILGNDMDITPDVNMEETPESPNASSPEGLSEGSSGCAGFVEPDEVSISSIEARLVPLFVGSHVQRMKLLHKDVSLQLCCFSVKVRFGISTKFVDSAGRPRLSFVVDAPSSLCKVLEECDNIGRKFNMESGTGSDWRHVITRKNGFLLNPTTRVNIPTVVHGDAAQYATEMYHKEANCSPERIVFQKFDVAELESLIKPGVIMDTFLSVEPYDYQQIAGIRLVAKKLIIHREL